MAGEGTTRKRKGGLEALLESFVEGEIEAERKAERALHARTVAELVASGEAAWAIVKVAGDDDVVLQLQGPARVRDGDHLRCIPAGEGATLAEFVRSVRTRLPARPLRCRRREKDRVDLAGKLDVSTGDRVLLLDSAPHLDPHEALLDSAGKLSRSPSVAALAAAQPRPFAPRWMPQAEVLTSLSTPSKGVKVVQGPPGSGKTWLIAELALRRQRRGQSVLVVAFTHRALHQVAEAMIVASGKSDARPIYRDMFVESVPKGCRHRPDLPRGEGLRKNTLLVTAAKVAASWRREPPGGWDVVIVDEASQLALPSILAAVGLADEAIVVGDPLQLPPVARADDALDHPAADGLQWVADRAPQGYAIRETRRMNAPLARFASQAFYGGRMEPVPAAQGGNADRFLPLAGWPFAAAVPPDAGARLLLHAGTPDEEAKLAADLLAALDAHLGGVDPHTGKALTYAVATPRRDHVARLQTAFFRDPPLARRITAETVERLQGATASVCLFATGEPVPTATGPGRDLGWTLSARRLNVALTRGRYLALMLATRPWADRAASEANPDPASRAAFAQLLANARPIGAAATAPARPAADPFSPANLARLTCNIPRGCVATFGTLAKWAGDPGRAKDVFPLLLEAKRRGHEVYEHRVVKRDGTLHPVQAERLRREGVDPAALRFVS